MLCRLEDICKSYKQKRGKKLVLNNLSLRVDKSEFISIMGPSGSGKTTLLNILGGLDIQDSGNYYFQEEKYSQQTVAY